MDLLAKNEAAPPPAPTAAPAPAERPSLDEKEAAGEERQRRQAEPPAAGDDFYLGAAKRAESKAKDRADDAERRKAVRALYAAVRPTQQFVEHNYWHRNFANGTAPANPVAPNAFWRDFAAADAGQPFVSAAIAEANGSFLEMMFALALIDLPFEAGKHEVVADDSRRTLRAATPLLLVRKEVAKAEQAKDQPALLLGESFFRLDDRYVFDGAERREKPVTDEFLTDVAYGCQVVVTNPTSSRRTAELLLQIPAGSLPVQSGFWTRGKAVDLQPYATVAIEYAFYFPAKGDFAHYPVHAAEKGMLAAAAAARTLHVVDTPTRVDTASWEHVSQHGSAPEVLAFVDQANVQRLDLDRIAWRLRDRTFFGELLPRLRARHVWSAKTWSYAILHGDADATREYLRHADAFLAGCGAWLDSPLVTIDPIERRRWQVIEFDPLVHARAHRLGKQHVIGNADLARQYHAFLDVLGYRPRLDSGDWLLVTCYLLLQDRVDDALAAFAKIAPAELPTSLQYDYLGAYLCFYTGDLRKARGLAERHREHPVQHWRQRFATVLAQLDEAEGKRPAATGEQGQTDLAATAPSLEVAADGRNVQIRWRNLDRCEVRYYALDVEFAFSAQPFARADGGAAAFVQPNLQQSVELPAGRTELAFELPEQFHTANVLVEVRGGGLVRSRTFFANALDVRFLESYGQVAVADAANTPQPKTYVKVFARLPDGRVRFHKDGYTDLRGRFDYASVSDDPNAGADRYAVLVLNDRLGAVIREVAPPTK
jgi:hypothetical protein